MIIDEPTCPNCNSDDVVYRESAHMWERQNCTHQLVFIDEGFLMP